MSFETQGSCVTIKDTVVRLTMTLLQHQLQYLYSTSTFFVLFYQCLLSTMAIVSPFSSTKLLSVHFLVCILFSLLCEDSEQFQQIFGVRSTNKSLHTLNSSMSNESPQQHHQTRKKKKIVINRNLNGVDQIKSDGVLTERKKEQREAQKARDTVKSNLGVSQKRKKSKPDTEKKLSAKAQKLMDQRTNNGAFDGKLQAGLTSPADQQLQIQVAKRGNKQVTIVRGFLCTMDERKDILQYLKKKIGGGGTLIEGIIELQGSHSDIVVKHLNSRGFTNIVKR